MNRIFKVVNGRAVSELAKSVGKVSLVAGIMLMSTQGAMASEAVDHELDNTQQSFLEWVQSDVNKEKLEFIKDNFSYYSYGESYPTNKYLSTNIRGAGLLNFSLIDGRSASAESDPFKYKEAVGDLGYDRVFFYHVYSHLIKSDTYFLNNDEYQERLRQIEDVIKKRQDIYNSNKERILKLDDLFFTNDLKEKAIKRYEEKNALKINYIRKKTQLFAEKLNLRYKLDRNEGDASINQARLDEVNKQILLTEKEWEANKEKFKQKYANQEIWRLRYGNYEILKEKLENDKKQLETDVAEIWNQGEAEREQALEEARREQEEIAQADEQRRQEILAEIEQKKKEELKAKIEELLPKEVIQVVGDGETAEVDKTITTSTTRDIDAEEITTTTYTVSAKTGGQIAEGEKKAVSGDTIYNYLQKNQVQGFIYIEGEAIRMDGMSETPYKKISVNYDDTLTVDDENQLSVVKDGAIEKDNTGLVDGGTIFDFIKNNTTEGATTITVTDGEGQTHTFNLTEEGGYKVSGANNNITTEVSEDGMKIKLSNDLDLTNDGSVQVGGVTINNNGIDNGGHKITKLDKGAVGNNSTEAVNGSQLQEVIDMIANKGGATSFTVTDSKGQTHTFNFSEEGGYKVLGANDNISTEVSEEGMKIKLNNDLDLTEDGSVQVGGVTINNQGIDAGNKTITNLVNPVNDTDATNKQYVDNGRTKVTVGDNLGVSDSKGQNGEMIYHVTLDNNLDLTDNGSVQVGGLTLNNNGIDMGNKTISNLSAPLQDLDATNKKYVDDTNTVVTVGNNLSVSSSKGEKGENTYNVSLNKDIGLGEEGSISAGGVNIDKNGIDAGGKTIANVKDGEISETSKEAVNGSQLYQVQQQINSLDFSNINIDTSRLDKMIANNAKNIHRLDNRVSDLDKRLTRGIASSNALSGLAQPTVAGENMFSVGLGGYRNQQSLAIGYSAISENNKIIFKAGVATSMKDTKDLSWNTSVGFKF